MNVTKLHNKIVAKANNVEELKLRDDSNFHPFVNKYTKIFV